ncbi:MAG: hypothetical protein ABT940_00540 [Alphaproteobacteria bacterium]
MTVQEADQIVRRNFARAWADIVGHGPSCGDIKVEYEKGRIPSMVNVLHLLSGWR